MARVFISHSTLDNKSAADIKKWLDEAGFETPFLDIDQDSGITPGSEWERTLYRELERSDAVLIVLTANWMASNWCFAEFVHARAQGKPIYPVIESPAGERLVSPDIQHLDLRSDREGGLDRLARELARIRSDLRRGFKFEKGRSPYPGLVAFDEKDAAIYFGRDDEVRRLTEAMRAQRAAGSGNMFAILGASGSGKSSFLRAGLLPRLKQEAPAWTVLPPCRFKDRPIDALAALASLALGELDLSRWRQRLLDDPDQALRDFEFALKAKNNITETQIVVSLDQFEELFTLARPEDVAQTWRVLNLISEHRASFVVLMTLRSDFLDRLQGTAERKFDIVPFPLDPLPSARIPDIIKNPGLIVSLRIDEAFVLAAVRDAGTGYALPLLAFALREIYETSGNDGHWTVADYEALGDPAAGLNPIENAVRRAAERVMARPDARGRDAALVRRIFVPHLVRVNDEGKYVKLPARRRVLNADDLPFVDELIAARLLTTWTENGEQLIEAAHEALLTKWPLLKSILDEDREFLIARARFQQDLEEWRTSGEAPEALLSGLRLARARSWLEQRSAELSNDEKRFIQLGVDRFEARQRRVRLWRNSALAAALLVACGFALAAYLINNERKAAELQRQAAELQRARAEAALLANQSTVSLSAGKLATALSLAVKSVGRHDDPVTRAALLQASVSLSSFQMKSQSTGDVSPLLLTWSARDPIVAGVDGRMASWKLSGEPATLVALARNGSYDPQASRSGPVAFVSGADGRIVTVWSDGVVTRTGGGQPDALDRLPLDGNRVEVAGVSDDGSTIVVATTSSRAPRVFRSGQEAPAAFEGCQTNASDAGFVSAVAVSGNGAVIAIGFDDGRLCTVTRTNDRANTSKLDQPIIALRVSGDGSRLAARMGDGSITIAPADLSQSRIIRGQPDSGPLLVWSPDATRIAGGCGKVSICVWRDGDSATKNEPTLLAALTELGASPVAAAWSSDGSRLVSASRSNALTLWSILAPDRRASSEELNVGELTTVAIGSGGELAAGTATGSVMSIATPSGLAERIGPTDRTERTVSLAWHPSRNWLAAADESGTVRILQMPGGEVKTSRRFSVARVAGMQWLGDGETLAVADGGMRIALWSTDKTGQNAVRMLRATGMPRSADIQALVVDRARSRLLTTGADGRVLAWSLAQPGTVTPFEDAPAANDHARARSVLVLSPDGQRLVAAGNDGQLVIYSLETGRIERRIDVGGAEIDGAVFGKDATRLATSRGDGRIDLWDISADPRSLIAWFSLGTTSTGMAFVPKQNGFVVSSGGRLVWFSADPPDWLRRATTIASPE